MRAEVARALRLAAVRKAARGWQKAGWIDAESLATIEQRNADDRHRQGPALRTLLWIFTVFAFQSFFGLVMAVTASAGSPWLLLLIAAIGCAALAETGYGPMRLLGFGPESAASWMAVSAAVGFLAWLVMEAIGLEEKAGLLSMLALGGAVFALAGWRWGSPLMMTGAGAALFAILAGLPAGRLFWIVAGAALLVGALVASESARLAPSHRTGFSALALLAIAAIVIALNPGMNEAGWVESIGLRHGQPSPVPDLVAWLGSVAAAGGLLATGVRTRRRMLLDMGLLAALLLLVALADRVDVQPVWALLLGGAALLIGGALAVRRFLDSGREHERAGFTAEVLVANAEGRSAIELAVALATVSPAAARDVGAAEFTGKGGDFGGGGASSSFAIVLGAISLALAAAVTGCGKSPERAQPAALEAVDVRPPIDAAATTAGDPQARARSDAFSGVLPPNAPDGLPLEPGSALVDFGTTAEGRSYIVLQTSHPLDTTRQRFTIALRRNGWTAAGANTFRRARGDILVSYEPAGLTSRVRIEY